MRSLTITFLFLTISFCCLSQTPFTEKTVLDMKKRFIENPMKFLTEDLPHEYILSGSEGANIPYDQLKQMAAGIKYVNWDMSELRVNQYGKIGVATGVTKHSVVILSNNTTVNYHVRATYIYEYQQDRWRWISAQHTNIQDTEDKPEDVLKMFLTEYHKNPKAFFESRLPNDFRFLNGSKETIPKEGVLSNAKTDPTDSEVADVKAFQSGNLGIVSGVHVFKNRQSDGNIRADKVNFTYTMVKRNGKWFFAESHQTPLKE